MNEHNAQRLLVAWFRATFPHLAALFFAIPNGGARDPVTAKRLKDEGVLPGVPDLFLAVPRGDRHGMFVEMKAMTRGRVSPAQNRLLGALAAEGYMTAVPRGYEEAKTAMTNYLDLEQQP
jgi:hypothetical protein